MYEARYEKRFRMRGLAWGSVCGFMVWLANCAAAQEPAATPSDIAKHTITNSIGMELLLIPAGEFEMGTPLETPRYPDHREDAHSDAIPLHRVRITRPFYMGKYEVTQIEYERVIGKNPSWFSADNGGKNKVQGKDTGRFPVESVSWDEAREFCNKLTMMEAGRGIRYRLPTEAEWEYACRADTSTPFYFGRVLNGRAANVDGEFPYGTRVKGPSLGRTTHVGSYDRPNAFGLYDMYGNVDEWCWDWYDDDYYQNSPESDPLGPSSGSHRVFRGGSWAFLQTSADRGNAEPSRRHGHLGFRIVQEPTDK